MYVPELLAERRPDVIWDLIHQNPFGAIVVRNESELNANHLPFEVDPVLQVLRTHVSRANPLWLNRNRDEALIIFQGPNHYISPGWQPAKALHGRVAPSWNYAVVHAYGTLTFIEDSSWLLRHLDALAKPREAEREDPWSIATTPAEFVSGLMPRIVGIEMKIDRLLAKSQACQQYSKTARAGVIAGLERENTTAAQSMANIIRNTGTQRS